MRVGAVVWVVRRGWPGAYWCVGAGGQVWEVVGVSAERGTMKRSAVTVGEIDLEMAAGQSYLLRPAPWVFPRDVAALGQ